METDMPGGDQGTVHGLVLKQAARTPDAVAVCDAGAGEQLTYRGLVSAAQAQARRLRAAGVAPGSHVLVALPRSVAEIVGLLGTLLCGAVYVAVDPDWPAARLRQVTGISRPAAVLAAPAVAETLSALGGEAPVGAWSPDEDGSRADGDQQAACGPGELAYVSFTSGSTGVPKGVCIPHRAIVRLVQDPDYVRCGPGERFLRFAPLAFDASTLEVWAPLANGGTVEVFGGGFPSPAEFGAFLTERQITVLWLTSGLFRVAAEFCSDAFSGVRQVLTGGDVVPPGHVHRLLEEHPGLLVTCAYGPTENTTFTTVHHLEDASMVTDPLPIGRPVRGTQVFVLDDQARLVPPGTPGELYAAGDGLASGYLGNPEETARCFGEFSPDVPVRLYRTGDMARLDDNGDLQFLGRRDEQIKINGFRVELGEVRSAILGHPAVADAVVTAVDVPDSGRKLLVVVTPARGSLDEIRAHVAGLIPSFALPALWLEVDELPLTPNGKVDVAALATRRIGGPEAPRAVAGEDDTAIALARDLMKEVLKRDSIGDEDDFFALGGDSLGLFRLLAIVRGRHRIDVPLRQFYPTPTAAQLAKLIEMTAP